MVIAAGARPVIPPAIEESGVDYHTSDTIMRIADFPEHLVIVGGGVIAAEFAHVFSALGARITLVVRGSTFSGTATTPSAIDSPASRRANGNCIPTEMSWAPPKATRAWRCARQRPQLNADALLVATGRKPNADLLDAEQAGVDLEDGRVVVDQYQRTTARGIFALGDVSSPYQLKHVANHEARVVQNNLLYDWDDTDSMAASDHRFVPSAVFTDPQIACVGLTETEAIAQGFKISVKVQSTRTSPMVGRWRTPPGSSSSLPSAAPGACWARTSWATRRRRSSSR